MYFREIVVLAACVMTIVMGGSSSSRAVYDKCNLAEIGRSLQNDKVMSHKYHYLYCKTLMPFINGIKDRPIRMLEIGFGCGHHNQGTSALLWNKFFTTNNASLNLYEVDWKSPAHVLCAKKFLTAYPPGTIVKDIFLGDQKDVPFMQGVVESSGGQFDIIIDDGGHWGEQIRASFGVLWPSLADGGVYVVEDLGMKPSKELQSSFVRDLLGWQDQLSGVNHGFPDPSDVGWTKFPSQKPRDMVEIHCRDQICAMIKEQFY